MRRLFWYGVCLLGAYCAGWYEHEHAQELENKENKKVDETKWDA